MTIYEEQLSTLIPFSKFIDEFKLNLAYNAMQALLEYEGTLNNIDYEDYVIFFVDYDENDETIFAISKIIDTWKPIKINARVRKFTENKVYPYDSHGNIEFD